MRAFEDPSFWADNPIESLTERITSARLRVSKAAERSGRSGDSVRVVAVTKTLPVEIIQAAIDLGLTEIGENRVQEALVKKPDLRNISKFHLIGQLQKNKARKAVELFDLIQSVDGPKLASALDRIAAELGKKQRCLLEVKISKEETKSGLPWAEAESFLQGFKEAYPNLDLNGLMAVGPFVETEKNLHQLYGQFSKFFQTHKTKFGDDPILSLGMSDDFEIAIEEGSTMVRLGRTFFGERSHI
jgi:pyridoxal phosphate enzyme (YggS family)